MKNSLFSLALLLVALTCGACSPNHEANVRERVQQFVVYLLQEDYAACAELADPAFVRQHGLKGAELRCRLVGAVVEFGNITEDKLRIDEIVVDSEANRATVNISIQTGDEWKPIDSPPWVRVEGEWYMAF